MTDVFVSYARTERERIKPLVDALKALGLQVFFDIESLDGGDSFPDVIDKEVKSASVVLGCWTPYALTRKWVTAECLIADKRNVLVPVEFEPLTDVHVAFASLQRVNLADWQGDLQHEGWLTLVRTLAKRLHRPELPGRQIEKPATQSQDRPLFVRTNNFLRNLTREKLSPFFEPFGQSGTTFCGGLLRRPDILTSCEIDTPIRFAHFLGQLAHETGGFKYMQEERFSYSGGRLWSLFRNRFHDEAEAQLFAGQPEKIANRIYAGRMGNGDESSGDGWRYRGRGILMLTGRSNYHEMSGRIGIDLISDPDSAVDPEVSLAIAAVWWADHKVNELADADDVAKITRRLSGGTQNLQARAGLVARAKAVVGL